MTVKVAIHLVVFAATMWMPLCTAVIISFLKEKKTHKNNPELIKHHYIVLLVSFIKCLK